MPAAKSTRRPCDVSPTTTAKAGFAFGVPADRRGRNAWRPGVPTSRQLNNHRFKMNGLFGRSELGTPIKSTKYSHQNIPSGYLRISITDVCNMKCSYCHNEGQVGATARKMTIAELRYIVTNALRYGLLKVRLTGGEPLLHPDCHSMLRMLKRELAMPTVGFNTNGALIKRLLPIVSEKLIDDLVVGLDYVDGDVSKDSPVGSSSASIIAHILQIKELGQNVSIACVYDGNYER